MSNDMRIPAEVLLVEITNRINELRKSTNHFPHIWIRERNNAKEQALQELADWIRLIALMEGE